MEIKVNRESGFKPIDLNIKIETREELEILSRIFALNKNIPELLARGDKRFDRNVCNVVAAIFNEIGDLK